MRHTCCGALVRVSASSSKKYSRVPSELPFTPSEETATDTACSAGFMSGTYQAQRGMPWQGELEALFASYSLHLPRKWMSRTI